MAGIVNLEETRTAYKAKKFLKELRGRAKELETREQQVLNVDPEALNSIVDKLWSAVDNTAIPNNDTAPSDITQCIEELLPYQGRMRFADHLIEGLKRKYKQITGTEYIPQNKP